MELVVGTGGDWRKSTSRRSALVPLIPTLTPLLVRTHAARMASATALGKRRANFPSDPLGHPLARSSASFLSSRLTSFEHSTPLLAHHSCVNALAFSNGDGKWLASGGDDKRVLLWNSFGRLSGAEPVAVYRGARVCPTSSLY